MLKKDEKIISNILHEWGSKLRENGTAEKFNGYIPDGSYVYFTNNMMILSWFDANDTGVFKPVESDFVYSFIDKVTAKNAPVGKAYENEIEVKVNIDAVKMHKKAVGEEAFLIWNPKIKKYNSVNPKYLLWAFELLKTDSVFLGESQTSAITVKSSKGVIVIMPKFKFPKA